MGIPEVQNTSTGDVDQDKKQAAADKKVRDEVSALRAEAQSKNVFISASTTNPDAIRKEIERVQEARQNKEVESAKKK